MSVVFNYLYIRQEDYSEHTFFKEIKSFLPSTYCVIQTKNNNLKFRQHFYYSLEKNISSLKKTSDESFIETFKDSIKIRLRSDVSNGLLLSGGIDSSSIAAEVSNLINNKKDITFFHARSFENENDESSKAGFIANQLGNDLITLTPDKDVLINEISKVTYTQDQPFGGPSILMGYNIFRKIHESPQKVILGGQGADEILLGYERYLSAFIKPFNIFELNNFRKFSNQTSISYSDLLKYYFYFRSLSIRKFILNKTRCIKRDFIKMQDTSIIESTVKSFNNPIKLQLSEIKSNQLPHLLRYEDRNSMAHSVESRLPFLDHRLVEKALTLDLDSKISNGWTKLILRKYLDDMNLQKIAWQKKKFGFEAPLNFWFNNNKVNFLDIIQQSEIIKEICIFDEIVKLAKQKDINKLWPYISLSVWESQFKVT